MTAFETENAAHIIKYDQFSKEEQQVMEKTQKVEQNNKNITNKNENIQADVALKQKQLEEILIKHEQTTCERVKILNNLRCEMERSHMETEKTKFKMGDLEAEERKENAKLTEQLDTLEETLLASQCEYRLYVKESETLDVELKELNKKCDDMTYEIWKTEQKLAQSQTPVKDIPARASHGGNRMNWYIGGPASDSSEDMTAIYQSSSAHPQ